MMQANEKVVLRRISYRISSWIVTLSFGLAATGLSIAVSIGGLEGDALLGVAASLGCIALIRRIFGARIILRRSSVTIVNPLMTYIIPCGRIAHVGFNGMPTIVTRRGDEIFASGFQESIIDYFMCTAEYAMERIEIHVRHHGRFGGNLKVKKRFTFSWIADLCTVGAAITLLLMVTIVDG